VHVNPFGHCDESHVHIGSLADLTGWLIPRS
jgi:hypothetical protein